MPVQVLEDPVPEPTLAEKLAPWLRRVLIGGCLIWICFSMQTFSEDARTHTIEVTYPLLGNYARITAPQPGFDPQKAEWRPLSTGFAVPDGAVFFVKTGSATYAVRIWNQRINPELACFSYVTVGHADAGPGPAAGTVRPAPDGITLPGCTIAWSGKSDGAGYLYLDEAFIWNKPPRYTIGVPFQSGSLDPFRQAVPAGTHFESQPWKIADAPASEIIPAP
jgi:hypothetical protein